MRSSSKALDVATLKIGDEFVHGEMATGNYHWKIASIQIIRNTNKVIVNRIIKFENLLLERDNFNSDLAFEKHKFHSMSEEALQNIYRLGVIKPK